MRCVTRVVLAGCCWLPGCLQIEQTITLDAAGAGTQEVTMTLSETLLAELRAAAAASRVGSPVDPAALFTEAAVRKDLETAGLELAAHAVATKDRARTVRLTARFRDPAGLRRSPLTGSAAEWEFTAGPRPGTVQLTLYPQGRKAWGEARAKALAMQDRDDPLASDFFARRKTQLTGLDVTLRFRLPGAVLQWTRNLEKTGECEVTARITAEQIATPADLVRRLAPRFQVVFDAAGTTFPVDR